METQVVVPLTLASAENGSGPIAHGYLWCSELTFEKEPENQDFRKKLLVQNGQFYPLDAPRAPH